MKNKKGFTLVEIIVAIAIGSIVLMIAGSMMVSSFKFMFSTTDTDMNKLMTDNIIDLVRSEVEYAYDVRLVKSGDANEPVVEEGSVWHCYHVQEGQLYRDNQPVLNEGYYEGKKIKISLKADYDNKVRVDFRYHLYDSNHKDVYGARDTIMFLNIRISPEIDPIGLYTLNEVYLNDVDFTGKDSDEYYGYKLYFKNSYTPITQ